MTTFSFTARPSTDQQKAIARHVGARRFAWNQSLRLVLDAEKQKKTDPTVEVPRTAYSLINAINGWKRSEGAGRRFVAGSNGQTTVLPGLPWRHQVCAQVFEEAAVDLARALGAADKAKGTKRRVGFPSMQKKGRGAESFRLRNKVSKTCTPSITLGGTEPRSITLPVLGTIPVREDTRALRRLLGPGTNGPRARVCQVTVALRSGRVVLYVTLDGPDRHPARPDRSLTALRRADRTAARQQKGSKNRRKAHDRLQVIHARVANQRKDFLHRSSSTLVKTHDRLCLEDLAVANLVRNRHLARRIADAGWGTFRQMVDYKASWYGTELTIAPRWFPSSRTCSSCRWHWAEMTLSDRVFRCAHCGAVMDRDRNAAVNLALWANAESSSASQAPDPEARGRVTNACGGTSAGHRLGGGGTGPATAGEAPAKKQEPALLGDRA